MSVDSHVKGNIPLSLVVCSVCAHAAVYAPYCKRRVLRAEDMVAIALTGTFLLVYGVLDAWPYEMPPASMAALVAASML